MPINAERIVHLRLDVDGRRYEGMAKLVPDAPAELVIHATVSLLRRAIKDVSRAGVSE